MSRNNIDYVIRITFADTVLALENLHLETEGTVYTPEEFAEGLPFDFLPKKMAINIKGTLPNGKEVDATATFDPRKVPVKR